MEDCKGNQNVSALLVTMGKLVCRCSSWGQSKVTNEASNQGADCLEHGPDEKGVSSANAFDEVQCGNCSGHRYSTENGLYNVGAETIGRRK